MVQRPETESRNALCSAELVERRWDHRRRLRLIPDHAIIEIAGLMSECATTGVGPTDVQLAELAMRDRADDLVGDVEEALDLLATLVKAWAASRVLNRCSARTLSFDREPPTQRYARVLSSIENSAAEGFRNLSPSTHLSDGDAFHELVALMIWANDLAGDGYIDPRVARVRNARPPQ
jgi:hypothetical protein